MKRLMTFFIVMTFFSCGKTAQSPNALKDGIKDMSGTNAVRGDDNLFYPSVPNSILMVWLPSEEYHRSIAVKNKKYEATDFKNYRSLCMKSIAINSNKNLISAKLKYDQEKEIDKKFKAAGCSFGSIEEECEELEEERDYAMTDYMTSVGEALVDIQKTFDPHIDWEGSIAEEQDRDKLNIIYPIFYSESASAYEGTSFDISEKTSDYKITLNRFGSEELNYSSEKGEIEIIERKVTSIGNRFFIVRVYEKNTKGVKLGSYFDLEVEESYIYGSRRYEGKTFKYDAGEVVKEGIFKLEQIGEPRN